MCLPGPWALPAGRLHLVTRGEIGRGEWEPDADVRLGRQTKQASFGKQGFGLVNLVDSQIRVTSDQRELAVE